MKQLELYEEPLQILKQFENYGYAGMSDFELSFLCGALKAFRPKKIVEIGVAAGGTTTVILNCLEKINTCCEIYSVDICEKCYIDTSQKTGFIARNYLKQKTLNTIKHQFMLGETIASRIDEIGRGIDFVILDTMHALPGELLDFISLYPYLDKRAVIVFHDVGQSQLGLGNINGAPYEYASLVTLSTIMGEKYMPYDKDRIAGLSNIGAVRLNENTPDSIENLFLSLFVNWNYIPDKKSLEEYRKRIIKEYNACYYKMFEQAIECNMFSLYRRGKLCMNLRNVKKELDEAVKKAVKIYIYGAGKISKEVKRYVEIIGGQKRIAGHVVTINNLKQDKDIFELEDIAEDENILIILGLDEKYHLEVLNNLYHKNFTKRVFPYNGIGFREMIKIIRYENAVRENMEEYINLYGYEQWISQTARENENEK